MPSVKRVFGLFITALVTLGVTMIGIPALAANDPGLGTKPGNGTLVSADLTVNQPSIKNDALPALRDIRAQMYDDPEVLFEGKRLSVAVSDAGLTRDQYINNVRWDSNMEKSALQRAYEQNIYWGHVRPDGSSYKEADLKGRWPAEILTTQADIATAISDVDNGSWAGERDALIAYNGRFNNDTGHLYNLINPNYTYYGFARVGGVTVGWMTGSVSGNQTGTGLSGSYTFTTAVSPRVLAGLNGKLEMTARLNPGQSGTATLTGVSRAQSWLPSVSVSIDATYTSSNTAVLSINQNGAYTAVGGGTATVTARTTAGRTYTQSVTVTGDPVAPTDPQPGTSNEVTVTNSWTNLNPAATFTIGQSGDDIVVGDWNGDGVDTLGIRRGNTFYLYNTLDGKQVAHQFDYGRVGDEVLVGDWDGNGYDTLGVRRGNTFFLNDTLRGGNADHEFNYGRVGDEVLIGNWNGTASDTISVRRETTFFINNTLRGGWADEEFNYGRLGDESVIGDFDGDGTDTVSLRRGNVIHLNNRHAGGNAERSVTYGNSADTLIIGDWNGDGIDTPGLVR